MKRPILSAIVVVLFILGGTPSHAADQECRTWFENLKIDPQSKDCRIECESAMTDMGTFMCPSQCSDFWKGRLSAKTNPFKAVDGDEREKLIVALDRLPKIFQPRSLKALVKGTRPVDFSAPTSPATSSIELGSPAAKVIESFGNPQKNTEQFQSVRFDVYEYFAASGQPAAFFQSVLTNVLSAVQYGLNHLTKNLFSRI